MLGITQSGDLSIGGTTDLGVNIANDILLDRAGNDFVGGVFITSGKNVTLVDANTLDLAGGTVSGNLSVTANGAITQSGSLAVTGTTTLAAGAANDITLNNANNFSTVAITSGNNVTLVDSNGIDLGASNVSGNFDVMATTGNISNSGALLVTGNSTFTADAAGANIILGNAGNNFAGTVTFAGAGGLNDVTITDLSALDLGGLTLTGNLLVTAGGAVTDSGNLVIGGTTTVTATGFNVTLDQAGNDFTGPVGVTGANVTLVDANGINLGASTVTGSWDDTFSDASGFVYGITDAIGLGHVLRQSNACWPVCRVVYCAQLRL